MVNTENPSKNNNVEAKVVYDSRVARHLIKMGYHVIDISPDKFDRDHKRTVFVFKNEGNLIEDMFAIVEKLKSERTARMTNKLKDIPNTITLIEKD